MSDDLPAIHEAERLAPRDPQPPRPLARREPALPPAAPAGHRLGRRLLGTALLVAALGLGSCHAFVLAIFG